MRKIFFSVEEQSIYEVAVSISVWRKINSRDEINSAGATCTILCISRNERMQVVTCDFFVF